MFDEVGGDTSTLEAFYFEAPTNEDSTQAISTPPKSDFGETIQQQQQQQHRGLNQICHKTI